MLPRTTLMLLLLALPVLADDARTLEPAPGNLEGSWRLRLDPAKVGDAAGWASPELDDGDWELTSVPAFLDREGGHPEYDGDAWYRLSFRLPASWRGRPLAVTFGAVDDWDWTWLNGALLGSTGEGLEIPSAAPRRYRVPADALRWDDTNVLVVRVRDLGGPGGLQAGPLSLLPADELERRRTMLAGSPDRPLAERFAEPPGGSRILKIIHGFPKDPTTHEAFLDNLLLSGFGGVVCNVHFDEYLESEPLWESFLHGVAQARARNMTLWLYDEQGYPSGNAGELVLRDHPEWQARGLLVPSTQTIIDSIELELPEGDLLYAAAAPIRDGQLVLEDAVDLSDAASAGRLHWSPPEDGRWWKVLAFVEAPIYEGSHAAMNVYVHRPYVNLLEREATELFLDVTHREYARRIPDLAEVFQSTFTDEPSLMTTWLSPMPYPALPWSLRFREHFREECGYDLVPLLPALVEEAGATSHRARCDFWRFVAEELVGASFGPIRETCEAMGLPAGGHFLLEEPLTGHVGFYGDFLRCAEELTYPGIDCLTSVPQEVPWSIGKLLGSVAHLKGAPRVMSETSDHVQRYRPPGDTRPPVHISAGQIRGTCNRLYVGGVNVTTSYYSFDGLTAAELNTLNEYVARIGTPLTGGMPINDIAVLYPIESMWARHRPARSGFTASEAAQRTERLWNGAQTALFEGSRDYEILSSRAVASGSVSQGALSAGPLRFRVVVAAGAETMPLEAVRRLRELWRSGGSVVFVGDLPRHSLGRTDDPEVLACIEEMLPGAGEGLALSRGGTGGLAAFLPDNVQPLLLEVLASALEPDFATATSRNPLRYAHRLVEGQHLYFIINDSDGEISEECSFAASGEAEVWNPETGSREPLATRQEGDRSLATLTIGPWSSRFVVFPEARERHARTADSAFALVETPLEEALGGAPAWTVACGGPCRLEDSALAVERDGAPVEVRLCDVTLEESVVDTWCFARVGVPEGALAGALGLRISVWVPEGQESCGARMFSFGGARSGGEFLADLSAVVSRAGWREVYLWFSGYQPVQARPPKAASLEPEDLDGFSVGWGGYTSGKAGERVRFGVGPIAVIRRAESR